jgi:hypothetical protein
MGRMQRIGLVFLALGITASSTTPGRAASIGRDRILSFGDISQWTMLPDGGWVTVEKGRVRFFAPDSSERKAFELRGKEVLVATPEPGAVAVAAYADAQPTLLRVVQFDVYGPDGERRVGLKDPDFASAIIAPNGNAFVGLAGADEFPQTVVQFYDATGRKMNDLPVRGFEGGRFCSDGARFLFETAAEGLQVATAAGQVIDTLGRVDVWDCSPDGRVIVTAVGPKVVVYRDGEAVAARDWPRPTERVRDLAVSPSGTLVGAVSASQAALLRVNSPDWAWRMEPEKPEWNFRSVAVADDPYLAALGVDFDPGADNPERHLRSRCLVVDSTGQIIHTEEGTPSHWGAVFPQVRFAGDGVLFIDRDAVRRLTITR